MFIFIRELQREREDFLGFSNRILYAKILGKSESDQGYKVIRCWMIG